MEEEKRMPRNLEHGAIPTVTIESAEEISNPNGAVRHLPDLANS
jgi:hypothetical protein